MVKMSKVKLFSSAAVVATLWATPAMADVPSCGTPGLFFPQCEAPAEGEEPVTGPVVFTFQNQTSSQDVPNAYTSYQAISNGAYSNLDEQAAAAAAWQEVAQEAFDAAADVLADAQAALDEALAGIDEDEQAALDAVITAQAAFDEAEAAFEAAEADVAAALAARDEAQDAAAEASTAFNEAVQARIAAEAALDADPDDVTKAAALLAAQEAEAEAAAAIPAAAQALADAEDALEASQEVALAAFEAAGTLEGELDDAITAAAAVSPTVAEIQALTANVTVAEDVLQDRSETLDVRNNAVAAIDRSAEVLEAAAASENEAIAAVADAYTGERTDTYAEIEVVAALVDHEARITATEEGLVEEAALRIAGDAATLAAANVYTDTAVAAEATARIAADNALGTRITNETNARIAADNALGQRITDETNARIAADNVLRDQIASSTATAIALGGTTILPDTNFTLSGNVGFYQGAQAVAVNAAAKVGENAYITGAVGGGLNKQGNVGGRVGFVIGF